MKTTHPNKTSSKEAVADTSSFSASSNVKTVSEGSLFARMLKTKKLSKAYLNGEITRAELESAGVEIG